METTNNANVIKVEATGAIVLWRTSSAEREKVHTALKALGNGAERFCPERDTPLRAMKRAIARWADRQVVFRDRDDVLVRSADKAVNLVRETKGADSKNDYTVLAKVMLPTSRGDIDPSLFAEIGDDGDLGAWTEPPADLVQIYREERASICASALGQIVKFVLRDIIECARVRPEGGVFWCPEDRLPALRAFGAAIEDSSDDARIYIVETAKNDSTIRMIGDALASEVKQLNSEVNDYLDADDDADITDDDDGRRNAPPRYTRKVESARAKLERYERELGAQFDRVKDMVEEVNTNLDRVSLVDDCTDLLGGLG